jgi:5-methylcytosine-specific restriction endonuclease McrA
MGTIKWILDREFTSNPERWGVIKIDTRESFSRNDIYQKWIEQDKKCYYTGREITQDELVGDHIIPRNAGVAQGGVTEYFNLAVTDSATNTAKSQLSAEDFQKRINIQMSAYA